MHVFQIWIIFIFTVAEYVHCGDNPSNTNGTIEIDSHGEDDNFEVTEQTSDQPTQEPEEQPYPLGPTQPIHQPFTPEPEQTEPLDLSMKPTQPQPVEPVHQLPIHYVHPPQQEIPVPIHQPIATYPPRYQPHPGYYYPLYPHYPSYRPYSPRYPQVPYSGYYYPRYPPYHGYRTPRDPYAPGPTQYVPPPSQPMSRSPIHYVPQPSQPAPAAPRQPTETKEKVTTKRIVKKCKTVKFMKKDSEGKLVQMSSTDYKKIYTDSAKMKFKLYANLEQVFCDGDIAYEHSYRKPYPSTITQNRRMMEFVIRCGDELIVVKNVNNKWKRTECDIPFCFQLYTKDSGGNDALISKENYYVDLSTYQSFKYSFLLVLNVIKFLFGIS